MEKEAFESLISHSATSRSNWGGRRKLPYVFTEHGTLMAGTILKTECAH
ncbi:ORF6N domain-containing protein [Planctomycetota bacterium]